MIDIYDISFGWAVLQIGYCVFNASYLTDIKSELDYLFFDLGGTDECSVRKVILEGESQGDLALISHLTFEDVNQYLPTSKQRGTSDNYDYVLNIIWQRLYSSDANSLTIMKFPYREFLEEYKELINNIKDDYINGFICPDNDEEYREAISIYEGRRGK